MTESDPHVVDPGDEARHAPEEDALWNESHYLDFVSEDGTLAGYLRIGLYPNLGVTWWTAMVVGPGRPTVASMAYDLPVPASGLGLHGGGFAMDTDVLAPLAEVRVHGTAPAAVHDDPAAIYREEAGDPTTIGFDLTWRTDGVPYQYAVTTRYEIPCLVEGTVTVGGESVTVTGHGQRDHSWGVRDWWAFGWCWLAGRLDDGTRVHAADIRIPGMPLALGYLQPPSGEVLTVSALEVTEDGDGVGFPTKGRAAIEPGGIDLTIEPVAFGPLVLTSTDGRVSRFTRAQVRFVAADGRHGTGWVEWNQPQPDAAGR